MQPITKNMLHTQTAPAWTSNRSHSGDAPPANTAPVRPSIGPPHPPTAAALVRLAWSAPRRAGRFRGVSSPSARQIGLLAAQLTANGHFGAGARQSLQTERKRLQQVRLDMALHSCEHVPSGARYRSAPSLLCSTSTDQLTPGASSLGPTSACRGLTTRWQIKGRPVSARFWLE